MTKVSGRYSTEHLLSLLIKARRDVSLARGLFLDQLTDRATRRRGSYVRPHSGSPYALRRVLNGKPAIVIETDAEAVVSACKGAKKYRLLPIGGAQTVTVEERWIMKARKVK